MKVQSNCFKSTVTVAFCDGEIVSFEKAELHFEKVKSYCFKSAFCDGDIVFFSKAQLHFVKVKLSCLKSAVVRIGSKVPLNFVMVKSYCIKSAVAFCKCIV